jgi:hypothetical protein
MRPQQEQHTLIQILKASLLYFALVFGVGFVLGTIRTLWVAPRVGFRNYIHHQLIPLTRACERW